MLREIGPYVNAIARYPATEDDMAEKNTLTKRLALLEEVSLSPTEVASVVGEIEDLDRIVAELEEFGQATPWISLQTQPSGKKV